MQDNSRKNIYFCFIDNGKTFDCEDHNKLWKIIKVMGIPDHLTCLLRNLYAGQEATVRTGHGTTNGFQMGKEYNKVVYCHPAYLTYTQSTLCKMPGWSHHFMTNRRGKSGSGDRFSFLCFHNHCGM